MRWDVGVQMIFCVKLTKRRKSRVKGIKTSDDFDSGERDVVALNES